MTYIVLIFFIYWCMFPSSTLTCVVSFLSLYTWFLLFVCNLLFLFHTKMSWWVLFKVFQKYRLLKSLLAINSLFAKFFKSLCYDKLYCIQQVSMGWVIYDFSHILICWLWFCHELPMGEIVRTYVIHLLGIYVTILCNWLILWQNALYLYLGRSWMCLIFQEILFQDQVLKPCKSV